MNQNEQNLYQTPTPIPQPEETMESTLEHTTPQNENTRRPRFETSLVEKIMAFLIFPVAFLYVTVPFADTRGGYGAERPYFFAFSICFLIMGEVMYWKRKRSWESIVFLVLNIMILVSLVFNLGQVWDPWEKGFFLHLYAVYWIMCRAGRLSEGETSHMFVWDGITGFFVMPFKNWPLNVRTIISCFSKKEKTGEKKKSKAGYVILAVIAGVILFAIAMACLKEADENYKILILEIEQFLKIKFDTELIVKLFLVALLVPYLYGLLGGCYRESAPQVSHRGDNIKKVIGFLAKVPNVVWSIFIGVFSFFYVMFFVLQGSYLFGAFQMILPQQYTFAEYARKGFFETCAIMAINMILLWLAIRTSEKKTLGLKIACGIFTGESLLFSVIALLKLFMYIQAYGFTPLRLQSFWFVIVLILACICILISMYSGKKTAKIWFMTSAASLAILCLF